MVELLAPKPGEGLWPQQLPHGCHTGCGGHAAQPKISNCRVTINYNSYY